MTFEFGVKQIIPILQLIGRTERTFIFPQETAWCANSITLSM